MGGREGGEAGRGNEWNGRGAGVFGQGEEGDSKQLTPGVTVRARDCVTMMSEARGQECGGDVEEGEGCGQHGRSAAPLSAGMRDAGEGTVLDTRRFCRIYAD